MFRNRNKRATNGATAVGQKRVRHRLLASPKAAFVAVAITNDDPSGESIRLTFSSRKKPTVIPLVKNKHRSWNIVLSFFVHLRIGFLSFLLYWIGGNLNFHRYVCWFELWIWWLHLTQNHPEEMADILISSWLSQNSIQYKKLWRLLFKRFVPAKYFPISKICPKVWGNMG